jgi:hypothetical protein
MNSFLLIIESTTCVVTLLKKLKSFKIKNNNILFADYCREFPVFELAPGPERIN